MSAREQFAKTAQNYLASATHARGWDLGALVEAARPSGLELLLDVATGPGHVIGAFAPHVRATVGVDVVPEMLRLAKSRAVPRSAFVLGDGELLPFAAARFDLVTCRFAAHHMRDLSTVLAEVVRVLAPAGIALLVDTYAPDKPGLDRFVNDLERLRDSSHIRSRGLGEWRELLAGRGLLCEVRHRWEVDITLEDWFARAKTAPSRADAARAMLADAPRDARDAFAITNRGFRLRAMLIVARAASHG